MVGSTIAARAWPAAGQGLAGLWRVARAIRRLIASTKSERRSRGAIGEWRALDDHVLADLGLTRAHIGYAEYAAQRGKLPKGWNHGLSR